MRKNIDKLLNVLSTKFTLIKENISDFEKIKVGPMKFKVEKYKIDGIGNLSIMEGKAMFGLMKMDTVVITPVYVDAPLLSYDRIIAMGNDTLMLECFDTAVENKNIELLEKVKTKYSSLKEYVAESKWYDEYLLSCTIAKKDKKITKIHNELTDEYLFNFVEYLTNAKKIKDVNLKIRANENYVNGLLNDGGPSTKVFVEKFGKEKTEYFYKNIIFSTNEEKYL